MHGVSAKHRASGGSIVGLNIRDTLAINTPLPVSSVLVARPLSNHFLANDASVSTQSSTSPNSQPAPSSTASSGGTGGDDGGTVVNVGGGGSVDGGSGGDGGESTPIAIPQPTSGGGIAVPSGSTISNPTSPVSVPGNLSGSSNTNNTVASSSWATSSSGTLNGVGGQGTPFNAGAVPSTTISAVPGASTPGALITGLSSPSQYSLDTAPNPPSTTSPLPAIPTSAAISSGKHLSGGAIAGIVIVSLSFLLALILVVIRRCSTARRTELRKQWFGRRGRNILPFTSENPRGPISTSRPSSRSSFATNFDQGLMFSGHSPPRLSQGIIPILPPMAEIYEPNLSSAEGTAGRRETVNSMMSNGSDPDAQYVTVPCQHNLEPSTPMSVRPFSPSESFSFPKPPATSSSTAESFFFSRTHGAASSRSSATFVRLSTPPRAFIKDLPASSVSIPSPYPRTLITGIGLSFFIPLISSSIDPFADPMKPGFADIEVICRPFKPSLDDELAVRPGDRVRLLRIFDDGWAFIEKMAGTEGEWHEQGLIPIDCLREVSQALPTFLTQKRVSIYGQAI